MCVLEELYLICSIWLKKVKQQLIFFLLAFFFNNFSVKSNKTIN